MKTNDGAGDGRSRQSRERAVVGQARVATGTAGRGVGLAGARWELRPRGTRRDEPRSAGSWWLGAPRDGFTHTCRTHEPRMMARGVRYYADLSDEVKKRRALL